MELLVNALSDRVGSPLSVRSLSEELGVAHATVARWLGILEALYVCFRIAPFGAPRIRAVKKEAKLYLWDWSETPGRGERFENLVACQLLKYCHHVEDTHYWASTIAGIRRISIGTIHLYVRIFPEGSCRPARTC